MCSAYVFFPLGARQWWCKADGKVREKLHFLTLARWRFPPVFPASGGLVEAWPIGSRPGNSSERGVSTFSTHYCIHTRAGLSILGKPCPYVLAGEICSDCSAGRIKGKEFIMTHPLRHGNEPVPTGVGFGLSDNWRDARLPLVDTKKTWGAQHLHSSLSEPNTNTQSTSNT